MLQHSFLSLGAHGFHRIAYTQWGEENKDNTVFCVHGLTRNGRDFDTLAAHLSSHRQIICPDIAGRGASDWLLNPMDYGFHTYVADMAALLAKTGSENVDWVGSSMGGIIGMLLAAQPNSPIRRLIINDVGPFIPKEAMGRIGEYLGQEVKFPNLDALENYLRVIHKPFGPMNDDQWRHMAKYSSKKCDDGQVTLHFDPAISEPFKQAEPVDVDLWPVWESITCPVLILRGEDSDVLMKETADEMLRRGPDAEMVEIPGIGHAPALMDDHQIQLITRWLDAG